MNDEIAIEKFIANLDFLDLEKLSQNAGTLDKILGIKYQNESDVPFEVESNE
ncbi:hypothetical protein KA977_04050 [Candidatus Dependentiae bacterium]|nr:hypothetical protein [Candidatus Dependentiae bacterium]